MASEISWGIEYQYAGISNHYDVPTICSVPLPVSCYYPISTGELANTFNGFVVAVTENSISIYRHSLEYRSDIFAYIVYCPR
jgi:hypothetical protein